MNRLISQKFRFFSFVCIALLLFVHGYNLKVTYLQPFSLVDEPMTFTTFTEYFLANGILRFRLPMLFIITGYLFALQDNKPYKYRVQRRFVSLAVPYLIWSALAVLFTYLLQQFPVTAQIVQDSKIDQMRDYRPYSEIGWGGVLYRWIRWTPAFQLWFLRSLFFYNLLYPVFKWAVVKFPAVTFSILFLGWITFFNFSPFEGQGMFFYTLGIWLYKTNYPIHKKPEWFGVFPAWLLFIGLNITKTFMAFEFDAAEPTTRWVFSLLYTASAAAGVMALWFGCDKIVAWAMSKKWFTWATAFSFFIFVAHVPLLPYLTTFFYTYLQSIPHYRLVTYITVPLLVLLICISSAALLRRLLPKMYRVVTGGRGF